MDGANFLEWFNTIVIPWAKKKEGKKVLIGENLSLQISPQVIHKCEELNIAFILLPPNATEKLQPLDVSFFVPLKREWRKILEDYRKLHPSSTSLVKGIFPMIRNNLIKALGMRSSTNLISGFRAYGNVPFIHEAVLSKFPSIADATYETATANDRAVARLLSLPKVSDAVLEYLHQFKYSPNIKDTSTAEKGKKKRNRLPVSPRRSVSMIDKHPERIPSNSNQDNYSSCYSNSTVSSHPSTSSADPFTGSSGTHGHNSFAASSD